MRPKAFLVLAAAASLTAIVSAAVTDADPTASARGAGAATRPAGVAVVELFTSEGCSSCPAADRLLGVLDAEANRDGTPVYVLAFHVDYWDRLGWADRFASADHSRRQHAYAAAARTRNVYTPQMVVNGAAAGFVGSDEAVARRQVAAALARPAAADVRLAITRGEGATALQVGYDVGGEVNGCVLNLAVVERETTNAVTRGENAGQTLRHTNVVRLFRTIDLKVPAGKVELTLPAGLKAADTRVVGYVQDVRTLQVRGASAGAS